MVISFATEKADMYLTRLRQGNHRHRRDVAGPNSWASTFKGKCGEARRNIDKADSSANLIMGLAPNSPH